MIIALFSVPLALLCGYLSLKTWRMRYHRHAIALAAAGFFFSAIAISMALASWLSYDLFQGL